MYATFLLLSMPVRPPPPSPSLPKQRKQESTALYYEAKLKPNKTTIPRHARKKETGDG